MSRENLESLLDSMLEESSTRMEADVAREREEQAKREREAQAAALRARAAEAPEAPTFHEIATLTGLTDGDLRKVLAKAPPDDILVVLATGTDAIQRRVLANLSESSVAWMRANLAHMEQVSNAERESAQRKVLKAANELLKAGEITVPEPESVGATEGPDAEDQDLRALLVDLVRIASQAGPEALAEVLASAGEPLLSEGLAWVHDGAKGEGLRKQAASRRKELEADYAKRLRWMEEALVAIAEGEGADAFRQRIAG
jgi:hypothetical protein